jgi:dynein heavy chain
MRRHVYVTPKSYLSFIQAYNELYTKKYKIIDVDEQNIISGLDKLAKAGADVELLKKDLAEKGVVLKTATEETDKLL